MAEAVTLAHVARPAVLAASMDKSRYDVIFAAANRYSSLLSNLAVPIRQINSITQEQFLQALATGQPLHSASSLRTYVKDDLAILEELRPDVVVGDLRHSLSISARVVGIPYISIVNAYWSPYARQRFCVPDIPLTHIFGVPIANALFQCARPIAFALHCAPMNHVRKEYGLPAIGWDIRTMYTDADWVLYPDVPELAPTEDAPSTHRYIGPLLWTPSLELPPWWTSLATDKPIVYITLGSSGSPKLLSVCLEALQDQPLTLIVGSVRADLKSIPPNAWVADFLPGLEAARRASVVICNGGSPTSHQALAVGTPVVGLPSNMDQHLNMTYLADAGAGITLRSEHVDTQSLRDCVRRAQEPSYRVSASRIRDSFANYDAGARFRSILNEVVK